MDITLENAIFISEHQSEINEIINCFKKLRGKILCNTLLQLTRWDLIEKFHEVGSFVDENEITKNTLKLIISCIEEAKTVIESEDYKKLDETFKMASTLQSKLIKTEKEDNKNENIKYK